MSVALANLTCLQAANGSALLAQLLALRGLDTPEAIRNFLQLEHYPPTSGQELPDSHAAIARIQQALEQQEPILIYGDFDVDGQTGSSILLETLRLLGATVSVFIPHRDTDGHGLNATALMRLVSTRRLKLVITTDTGISNFNEVSLLSGLGVDTIITDHHELPENLPPAVANVNPQRLPKTHPMHFMCGAGVAYKLCTLLLEQTQQRLPENCHWQTAADALLDLAAMGTVADVAPLLAENRWIVWRGLQQLATRQRLGLAQILKNAGVAEDAPLSSDTIGFTLAPRLNAIGRLADANPAVTLLTTTDLAQAETLAQELERHNQRRQAMCDETTEQANAYLQQIGGLGNEQVIVLGSADWHVGIIGIVANRLAEQYNVPVLLLVYDEANNIAKGSARSVAGLNLHSALAECSTFFTSWGGHSQAAGVRLPFDKVSAFKESFQAVMRARMADRIAVSQTADAVLEWGQLGLGLVDLVGAMAPFGAGNPAPKFLLNPAYASATRRMGSDQQHLKLLLTEKPNQPNGFVEAIAWHTSRHPRLSQWPNDMPKDTPLSVLFTVERNQFNGQERLQLLLSDVVWKESVKAQTPTTRPSVKTHSETPRITLQDQRRCATPETWLEQWLNDATTTSLIYHEGSPPQWPFSREMTWSGRGQLVPAHTLIFWDIPPTWQDWQCVLNTVAPTQIILLGAKYQAIPLQPSAERMAAVLQQVLKKQGQNSLQNPQAMAQLLGTTPLVVLATDAWVQSAHPASKLALEAAITEVAQFRRHILETDSAMLVKTL